MKIIKENKKGGCFLLLENNTSTTIIYINRCEDFPDEYWYWLFDEITEKVTDEFLQNVLEDDDYCNIGHGGAFYSTIKELFKEVFTDEYIYENIDILNNVRMYFCKEGDTVYCTTSDQQDYIIEPIECIIKCIEFYDNAQVFEIHSKARTGGWGVPFKPDLTIPNHMNQRNIEDFGVNVFFDLDEAKEALKKK